MRLSVVIVTYGGEVAPTLDVLGEQKRPGDELIVVDNLASAGGTEGVRAHPAIDRLLEPAGNLHYAAGCNAGAALASGDAIVLLNPDAIPTAGFLDAMRAPPPAWDAWTGALTLPDGEHLNNGGGIVHFLALAWSGRYGEPLSALPAGPEPTGFLSGGCLAVRRPAWEALGGYAAGYGAYHEDVELSLRLRLEGRAFGLVPGARVVHDYDFVKGSAKWRNLERNRWMTIVRTYPGPVLLAVLPVLLAVEPALLAVGVRRGWWRGKLASYGDVARWLPAGLRERRAVQARARVSPRVFAGGLVAELDSPFFGAAGRLPLVQRAFSAYWRAVSTRLPV